jgi:hypothetical protein
VYKCLIFNGAKNAKTLFFLTFSRGSVLIVNTTISLYIQGFSQNICSFIITALSDRIMKRIDILGSVKTFLGVIRENNLFCR